MPYDEHGQHFVDLVTPASPVPNIAKTIQALQAAPPAARQEFFQRARQRMDPQTYNRAVNGLIKAGYALEGRIHGPTGPAGTPLPGGPTRTYSGPAPGDDAVYREVLRRSGVRFPSQQHPHNPTAGRR